VAAYVVLLLSAALGGPSIDAPFLPRPAAPTRGLAALPRATPVTTEANSGPADGDRTSGTPVSRGGARTPGAADGSTAGVAPVVAGATAALPVSPATARATVTSAPVATTGTPTPPATTPTATPSATPTHTGRSAGAPGQTVRPTPTRTR